MKLNSNHTMTKMKKYFIISCLFFSPIFLCYGYKTIKVEGFLNHNDKKQTVNSTASMFVLIKMIIADTVFQSTFLNSDGSFEFYKLCPTKNYKLKFYYLDYSIKPIIYFDKLQKDKIVLDCRFDLNNFADSVMKRKDFKFPECVTLEYFGNPSIAYESKLGILSYKYGFKYRSMGCGSFDEKEVNKEAIKKFNKSLGDNWKEVFWKEVKIKLK